VAAWQKRLNQVQLAALRCDGRFGPKTKTATAAFQRAKGLEQSGAVDRATWEAAR
jgi:peptidoglycan hydrolase-like protein with peptidoglycan-binding domain